MGLLTAFLIVLVLSQITIATGRSAPKGNKGPVETRSSSSISHSLRWIADETGGVEGDVRTSNAAKNTLGSSSRQSGEASSARAGLGVSQDKGAWEQWDKWGSSERHALAAVMVSVSLS